MGVEVANICMEKEVDSVTDNSNDLSGGASNDLLGVPSNELAGDPSNDLSGDPRNDLLVDSNVSVTGNSKPDIQTTDIIEEFEVKKCITEDITHTNNLSGDSSNEIMEPEACLVKEKTSSVMQQIEGESKKSNTTVKPSTKSANTKHTVPQPFALATEKRALVGTRPVGNLVAKSSSSSKVAKKTKEVTAQVLYQVFLH